jgi:hypothetical protein
MALYQCIWRWPGTGDSRERGIRFGEVLLHVFRRWAADEGGISPREMVRNGQNQEFAAVYRIGPACRQWL